jgi:hypothetical protein
VLARNGGALTFGLVFSVLVLGFVVPSLVIDTANAWFAWALLATAPLFLVGRLTGVS